MSRGALQLGWSFPLTERLNGYLQSYYGYGESLIDYNNKVNKLGIGIKLTDWLQAVFARANKRPLAGPLLLASRPGRPSCNPWGAAGRPPCWRT